MSKIYSDNIEKARMLVNGMTANLDTLSPYGITKEQLDNIAAIAGEAEKMSEELDAMRAVLSTKTAEAREKLEALKTAVKDAKTVAKTNFDQLKWIKFGIADKR